MQCPIAAASRRLAVSKGKRCTLYVPTSGVPCRPSRVSAAETLGPSVEHFHDVQRLSLAQSLELDGAAPEGHPDNTGYSSSGASAPAPVAVASSRSRVRTRAAAAAAAAVARSNGSSMPVTSFRRLRSSSSSSTNSSTMTRFATTNSSVGAASVPAASAAEQQQEGPAIPQLDTPFSFPSSSTTTNSSSGNGTTAAAVDASSSSSSSAGADDSFSSQDDEAFNVELQNEFHESSCCQDVLDIVKDELNRFAPFHTVTALNRLAKLGRSLKWEERREVLGEPSFVQLLDRLYSQVSALNPMQLATTLYSCASLQVPLEQLVSGTSSVSKLLPALEAAMQSHIKDFNDRDVSNALYAYAQMKARRQSSLQSAVLLCKQAQSLTDRQLMSGQSLSMTLWAVATLHTIQQQQRHSGSTAAFQNAAAALVSSAREHLVAAGCSFNDLGSQGVANSIWAAAKLEQHDPELLRKGCEWVAENAGRCKVQEVMNVLWAAGAGRYRPRVLQSITKHIAGQAEYLKPADVASLFHVLGIFGFQFSALLKQEQQEVLLSRAQQLLPQMKPHEATSLYWGLGMARLVDAELFKQITEAVSKLQLQQLAARAALQQHGIPVGSQQQQRQQKQQRRPDYQQQQQQQQQQQRLSDKKVQQLQSQATLLSDSNARQAFQAFIAAKLEDAEGVDLPPEVLAAFKQAWDTGLRGSSSGGRGKQRQHRQQPLLDDLQWMLEQMNIKASIGKLSQDGLLHVDVGLQASGQRAVALQLLDEHSCDMDGQKLASAQWEEDVLLRNGYDRVVWWQVAEWKRCPKPARVRLFAEVLRNAGVNPQERLVAAAEKAWQQGRMNKPGSSSSSSRGTGVLGQQGGEGLGMVGASGIRASEADLLMSERERGGPAGGWAAGGRGSRSRARNSTRR